MLLSIFQFLITYCREVDILQIVYAAHKKSHPGKTLLLQSYYSMKPLLAIVAACYDGIAQPLLCYCFLLLMFI